MGAASAAGSYYNQKISKGKVSAKQVVAEGLIGAAFGALAKTGGSGQNITSKSVNTVKSGSEVLFDWKLIKGTQPVIEGTNIPKSFVINGLEVNGNNVWVGGNATKHIGEFVNSANKAGGGLLSESEMMKSFMNAAKLATEQTLKASDNRLFVGGWEFGINGTTGVIYHALMK